MRDGRRLDLLLKPQLRDERQNVCVSPADANSRNLGPVSYLELYNGFFCQKPLVRREKLVGNHCTTRKSFMADQLVTKDVMRLIA